MKKSDSPKAWKIISVAIQLLLYAAVGAILFFLWDLQMLPPLYFAILAAAAIVLAGLTGFLLHRPAGGKWQKSRSWVRQVIGCILAAVLIAGCAVGSYAVSKLKNTLSSITSPDTVHVLLEVYVRADDPAQYIQDTGNYRFAISESTDEEDNLSAVSDLEKLLNSSVTLVRYPNIQEMIDGLYAGSVDAIILDISYLSILDGYEDFEEKARLLHEHVIEKEPPAPPVREDPDVQKPNTPMVPVFSEPSNPPFLLYISGNDARRELLADGGSDVNILVAVNLEDHQILMVNTPRDYYVVNPASGNGSRDKLSHCGLKGINNCIEAVTGLYGVPINYYARINFSGFRTLIDAMGGVTVNNPVGFYTNDYYFREGQIDLTGPQALAFARERKNLKGGDNDRGKNQMRLIEGMIDKLASVTLLTNYGQIMESLDGMFSTSMSSAEIAKLVQFQISEMPDWEIFSFAVTGDNGTDYCWAKYGYGYVMYPHQDEVQHAAALMEKVLRGEKITAEEVPFKK